MLHYSIENLSAVMADFFVCVQFICVLFFILNMGESLLLSLGSFAFVYFDFIKNGMKKLTEIYIIKVNLTYKITQSYQLKSNILFNSEIIQ